MLIDYKFKKFSPIHMSIIEKTNEIIDEYVVSGLTLTLRQMYYQFVGRGLFPDSRRFRFSTSGNKWVQDSSGTSNLQRNYKWLGKIISDAKLAGLMSWSAMKDLTRELHTTPVWHSPDSIIDACADQFKIDLWLGQPRRVFVWIEKDAGLSVVQQACSQHRVSYMSTRGFASMQGLHDEAMRHKTLLRQGITPIIILITDHDPSGMMMEQDLRNRFSTFGVSTQFTRIALTLQQVYDYNLPSDPCKLSDSRSTRYIDLYGERAYELDALRPEVLSSMITQEIESNILDTAQWSHMLDTEEEHRHTLRLLSDNYFDVISTLPY